MPKTNEKSKGELLPLPTTKNIDLHNLTAIRREMNGVYRDARNGKIEDSQGTKFIYILSREEGLSNEAAADELGQWTGTIFAARSRVMKRLSNIVAELTRSYPQLGLVLSRRG